MWSTSVPRTVRARRREPSRGPSSIDLGPDAAGKRRQVWRSGFATKREATAAMNAEIGQRQAGSYLEPNVLTVGAFLTEQWLPGLTKIRPSTVRGYRGHIEFYLVPAVGRHPVVRAHHPDDQPGVRRPAARGTGRGGRPLALVHDPAGARHAAQRPGRRGALAADPLQPRQRRGAARGDPHADAGVDRGAARRVPRRHRRRPAGHDVPAYRPHRAAPRGGRRAALDRGRPGRRESHRHPPARRRRLPGHPRRAQDPARAPPDRP